MPLTRIQVLELLIQQAAHNGFEFPRWWGQTMQTEWPGRDKALVLLGQDRRYYALLFSHSFAKAFWKQGSKMNFAVAATTYTMRKPTGELVTVTRRPYTRRTLKADAWQYHLREMTSQEEPLRYIRRFLQPVPKPKFSV